MNHKSRHFLLALKGFKQSIVITPQAGIYSIDTLILLFKPCPGFYHRPKGVSDLVDFVVARILDHLDIDQQLMPRWGLEALPDPEADASP